MKKQNGIWIDSSRAIIVTLTEDKHHVREIESEVENHVYHEKEGDRGITMGNRHGSGEKKFTERKKHQMERFLGEVIAEIKDADEVYIFGPAETKTALKTKVMSEKSSADKLKAVESADKMTLNQVVAKVKKFYAA